MYRDYYSITLITVFLIENIFNNFRSIPNKERVTIKKRLHGVYYNLYAISEVSELI